MFCNDFAHVSPGITGQVPPGDGSYWFFVRPARLMYIQIFSKKNKAVDNKY
jgi:hypothetical protein